MDLNNDTGEAEDRISKLPDSILHDILSFLDIKPVARTSVLSKRWRLIWTSIPILKFPVWFFKRPPPSVSEINKFMDFVDKTLYFHDGNIQTIYFHTNEHFNASRVHSWISTMTKHKIEILRLNIDFPEPFIPPLSVFTCESLIELELSASDTTLHLPKTFCFPKLKTLELCGIQFTDDNSWDEQHFSKCPVLEKLILRECIWLDARNFCISIPTLKSLELGSQDEDEGFKDCALEINAPNLVSFAYSGCLAKDYDFTTFQSLESAEVYIFQDVLVPSYGAAVNKFVRALSCVRSLEIYADTVEVLSFVNTLPTFHYLDKLSVEAHTTDKSLFSLLKAVPNLRILTFGVEFTDDDIEEEHIWAGHMLTSGCMFQHLVSVRFYGFGWHAKQMRIRRWLKLILENAKVLEAVKLNVSFIGRLGSVAAIDKEALMSELLSLPRASNKCEFELQD